MIVPMRKVFVVARRADQQPLLDALAGLGVIHIEPVDPQRAVVDTETAVAIDRLARAAQTLAAIEPAGDRPGIDPVAAADETLAIQRESAELQSRLTALRRQVEQLAPWGEMKLSDVQQLRDAGVHVVFVTADAEQLTALGRSDVECVQTLGELPGGRTIVAVVGRDSHQPPALPEGVVPMPLPARDRPAIRAEAADVDAQIKRQNRRLAELAHLADEVRAAQAELRTRARFTVAARSGLDQPDLYAVQGWTPADQAGSLASRLAGLGVEVAVESREPEPDENPPTLVRYPRWASPIKGLFDILGTMPGYREFDVSPFFMVALPIFSAMLIGDAGYGLLFVLLPLLFYRRMVAAAGPAKVHLLIVIGAVTMLWGVLTANYFGVTPVELNGAGGVWAVLGGWAERLALLWSRDAEVARQMIIKTSFVLGAAHLIVAHLKRAAMFAPDLRFLAELGWCVVIGDMLVLIWYLFFRGIANTPPTVWLVLGIGFLIPVIFGSPHPNVLKRISGGFAAGLLPVLGAFSDTMSYIRLMAVGLASYYIAAAFNKLAIDLAGTVGWWTLLPVLVLVFGHALNIGLVLIALFAHGVRLNMLEFSNNAGVQWAGYIYEPFQPSGKES